MSPWTWTNQAELCLLNTSSCVLKGNTVVKAALIDSLCLFFFLDSKTVTVTAGLTDLSCGAVSLLRSPGAEEVKGQWTLGQL